MTDLGKEFLEEKAEQLMEDYFVRKIKKFEERLEIVDFEDRLKIYTWEEDLHQKVSHFPEKFYAYKIEWSDGDIDYCIENKSGMEIGIRANKKVMMYYILHGSKGITYIKNIYEVLKDFIETKKEYRLRLLTGATKVEIENELQEILSAEEH